MSSDEMRVELESFVNEGITQGWHGWPLKYQFGRQNEAAGRFGATVDRITVPAQEILGRLYGEESRFARLARFGLGEHPC